MCLMIIMVMKMSLVANIVKQKEELTSFFNKSQLKSLCKYLTLLSKTYEYFYFSLKMHF